MRPKDPSKRSHLPLRRDDLRRLLQLAEADRDKFFNKYRVWREAYSDRVLCTALCQGAASHYLDPTVGINDFDVYTFYAANLERPWCSRRKQTVDFGSPRFGVSEHTKRGFVGRRVDLLGRSLAVRPGANPVDALRNYLGQHHSRTARELSKDAVILLEPSRWLGRVVWQPSAPSVSCR